MPRCDRKKTFAHRAGRAPRLWAPVDDEDGEFPSLHERKPACADRLMPRMRPPYFRPPNGSEVHPQDAFTRERTSGAPLAAMHPQLTLSVCKRRDAVRLALNEPARPAGAAFGVLSGATSS